MDFVSIIFNFAINNVVGLLAGAVVGWIIPQPNWASKVVSAVAPFINKAFAVGKALVDKFKTK